jgi:hypothetical protein
MKVEYKGFDVDARRDRSMGGETLLYYSVFRKKDGYEVTSGFSYGTDPIPTFIKYLKDMVDDFIENPQDYGVEKLTEEDLEPQELECTECLGIDATECPNCGGTGIEPIAW